MYPPQLPKALLKVPIQTSTSLRSTPQYSAMPRPVAPRTPIEWASSIINNALCRFFTSTKRGNSGVSPSML